VPSRRAVVLLEYGLAIWHGKKSEFARRGAFFFGVAAQAHARIRMAVAAVSAPNLLGDQRFFSAISCWHANATVGQIDTLTTVTRFLGPNTPIVCSNHLEQMLHGFLVLRGGIA